LAVDEFLLERLQGLVIEVKLRLEGPVRHTLALTEEVDNMIKEGVKVHLVASLGPLSQARVPVLEHLMCASMYHSRGRKERGRCGPGW
jgi:hypothetical protein